MTDKPAPATGLYTNFLAKAGVDRVADIIGRTLRKPCAIIDSEGKFLWANRAWCGMLGYTLDELIRTVQTDRITTAAEDIAADREQIARILAGEQDQYELVKFYRGKTGEHIHVRICVTRYPSMGDLDWMFVEAEILGDEYREAFIYATDQISMIAQNFSESNKNLLEKIQVLVVQQQQMLNQWEQSQWFSRMLVSGGSWIHEQSSKNPITALIVFMVIITLFFGPRVIEVTKEVMQLFSPTVPLPPGK